MTRRKYVGTKRGVAVEVAAWDGAGADVSLSCVAMFAREVGGAPPQGGLAHLNIALGGRLLDLRRDGYFNGRLGETMLIGAPPASVLANALLIIGLGDPSDWAPSALSTAIAAAVRMALALQVSSAAFAPSMLDSGLLPAQTEDAPAHMIEGLVAALDQRARLRELGLAPSVAIERWIFDVGAARFEQAAEQFQAELERH